MPVIAFVLNSFLLLRFQFKPQCFFAVNHRKEPTVTKFIQDCRREFNNVSVEQLDVVDVVSIDKKTGQVILTISDHLDWSDSVRHQTIAGEVQQVPCFRGKQRSPRELSRCERQTCGDQSGVQIPTRSRGMAVSRQS
jgi:hypothetical protein